MENVLQVKYLHLFVHVAAKKNIQIVQYVKFTHVSAEPYYPMFAYPMIRLQSPLKFFALVKAKKVKLY